MGSVTDETGAPAAHLERFVAAQDADGTYAQAVAELRAGRKRTHWMWFVFPQIAGLGCSATAVRFALTSLADARAYLVHPALGPRLLECTGVVAELRGRTAEEVFGPVDAVKLRSSMTLFLRADPQRALFQAVLDQYFDGAADGATDRLL
jgi:uncharacterized protein (DUF1810 family)